MTDLFTFFLESFRQLPERKVSVALSGGLDSVVLLHLLCRAREKLGGNISAIHVHHGLSSNADDWLMFCRQLCKQWQVPFIAEKVQLSTDKIGIEAAARAARYEVFIRQQMGVVGLGHHADDQVETLLLACLRGGGLRALSAMQTYSEWQIDWQHSHDDVQSLNHHLKLWRPLLNYTRQTLAEYAQNHSLNWIEDESNQERHYLRNFLRLDVLPLLQTRLPQAKRQLLASVTALQQDLSLFDEWAAQDKAYVYQSGQWRVSRWRELSFTRGQQVLLQLTRDEQLGTPTRASIECFTKILHESNQGEWQLPKGKVLWFKDKLIALPHDYARNWFWLPHGFSGSLKAIIMRLGTQSADFRLPENQDTMQSLVLRAAQRNDSLLMENGKHKSVFKILAKYGIPAALRPQYPVLCDEYNQILAILNLRVSANWIGHNAPQFLPLQGLIDS